MKNPYISISGKILNNIANAEYAKSIIENSTILPSFYKQLKKGTEVRILTYCFPRPVETIENIKMYLDGLTPTNQIDKKVQNIKKIIDDLEQLNAGNMDLDEDLLKDINLQISQGSVPEGQKTSLRKDPSANKPNPDEILAYLVQTFDWINSLSAREMHPLLLGATLIGLLNIISPFEFFNQETISVFTYAFLKKTGYDSKALVCLDEYFYRTKIVYDNLLNSIDMDTLDLSRWVEYFTENYALEVINAKEQIKLLVKDTKVAKASGKHDLTDRQRRIVEFIQDYGTLQNKAFKTLLPDVSEDSVLRDLKTLVEKQIVKKIGSTKSSRYEIA